MINGGIIGKYKLFSLINVFGATPTFLLPVFEKEGIYYFADINKGKIENFSKADITQFKQCKTYYTNKDDIYNVGDFAIYAIEDYSMNDYIVGNYNDIINYFNLNRKSYEQFVSFCNKMERFIEKSKCLEKTIEAKKSQNTKLIKRSPSSLSYPIESTDWFILNNEILSVKNRVQDLFASLKYYLKVDNIFKMWEILQRRGTKNFDFIFNSENSRIPLYIQLELITYIIANSDKVFDANVLFQLYMKYRYSNNKTPKIQRKDMYSLIKNEWKIDIRLPNMTEELCNPCYELVDMDFIFLFGIKKISSKLYALIAKQYETGEVFFCIVKRFNEKETIVNFIESLYSKKKNTLNLILCYDESKNRSGLVSDEMNEWLALNEDICVISGLHTFSSTD